LVCSVGGEAPPLFDRASASRGRVSSVISPLIMWLSFRLSTIAPCSLHFFIRGKLGRLLLSNFASIPNTTTKGIQFKKK
jgi:hypothetical protein